MIGRAALPALALAAVLCGCGAPESTATKSGDIEFIEDEASGLTYWTVVPAPERDEALPLLVFLHGCNNDARAQAEMTGWARLALERGFIAAFPQAPPPLRCWFFGNPMGSIMRDAGGAGALAAVTRELMEQWKVDARRVYLFGYSAGGTMTSVMGALYPDLYAAIGMVEGCPYLCADDLGLLAYRAMGEHARVLPVFIVTGLRGGYVAGGIGALQQWLGTNDLADDGDYNYSIARQAAAVESGTSQRGFAYDIEHYQDSAGRELIQRWVLGGMSHEYPEPGGDLPDATEGAYRFLFAQQLL